MRETTLQLEKNFMQFLFVNFYLSSKTRGSEHLIVGQLNDETVSEECVKHSR